ncbi:hypothetical protein CDL12_19751 [Handroanthus impetiginosus]|uniref:Uncharacterized protein n=1 Tax=Handroanthus impetiginosus TaxID=429701 RepID=A0A2G9GQX1_9LAMI|nr:hypothetical protein CDL12_19751 [Handroanthus impetiginosus]
MTITEPLNNPNQTTRSSVNAVRIRAAVQDDNGSRRRLIDPVRIIPKALKEYFKKASRRVFFGEISSLGEFCAKSFSFSFGALGINDVISAVFRTKVSFLAVLLNVFKVGFSYGLFLDAFKLAS